MLALIDGRISANLRHFLLVILIVAPMGLLALCGVMLGDKILRIKWFEKLFQWGDKLTGHTAGKVLAAWGLYRAEWKKVLLWAGISALAAFPLFIAALNCIASALVCSCGVHDFDALLTLFQQPKSFAATVSIVGEEFDESLFLQSG